MHFISCFLHHDSNCSQIVSLDVTYCEKFHLQGRHDYFTDRSACVSHETASRQLKLGVGYVRETGRRSFCPDQVTAHTAGKYIGSCTGQELWGNLRFSVIFSQQPIQIRFAKIPLEKIIFLISYSNEMTFDHLTNTFIIIKPTKKTLYIF